MLKNQPTFDERIRLMEQCARTVEQHAYQFIELDTTKGDYQLLTATANLIHDEVARMKTARLRFAGSGNRKTARSRTALRR